MDTAPAGFFGLTGWTGFTGSAGFCFSSSSSFGSEVTAGLTGSVSEERKQTIREQTSIRPGIR